MLLETVTSRKLPCRYAKLGREPPPIDQREIDNAVGAVRYTALAAALTGETHTIVPPGFTSAAIHGKPTSDADTPATSLIDARAENKSGPYSNLFVATVDEVDRQPSRRTQ